MIAVADLARRCAEERDGFRRGALVTGPEACLELFRRAIALGDPRAWDAVVAAFGAQVVAWVRRHGSFGSLPEPPEAYANLAWSRFARHVTAERIADFPRLASLLEFLRRCVASTLVDEARRAAARPAADALDAPLPDPAAGPERLALAGDARRGVWEMVLGVAQGEREAIVVREVLIQQRPPREVAARHPAVFASAADVSRAKENLLARLRRHPGMQRLLGGGA